MKYDPLFFQKLRKMSHYLLSAAVVIGAVKVNEIVVMNIHSAGFY